MISRSTSRTREAKASTYVQSDSHHLPVQSARWKYLPQQRYTREGDSTVAIIVNVCYGRVGCWYTKQFIKPSKTHLHSLSLRICNCVRCKTTVLSLLVTYTAREPISVSKVPICDQSPSQDCRFATNQRLKRADLRHRKKKKKRKKGSAPSLWPGPSNTYKFNCDL